MQAAIDALRGEVAVEFRNRCPGWWECRDTVHHYFWEEVSDIRDYIKAIRVLRFAATLSEPELHVLTLASKQRERGR